MRCLFSIILPLILTIALDAGAVAAEIEWLNMPKSIPVYAAPKEGASLLVMTTEGEKIAVRQRGARFARVQVKRGGTWKVGYVYTADLDSPEVLSSRGEFAFGGGGMYSYLMHSGKEFETDDQVQYSTKDFTSGSFSPFLMAQYGATDFWRLIFAYRLTDYASTAMTDVPGAAPRELTLEHSMLSFTLQKVWTPLTKPNFYFGLGAEVSRTIESNLILGGNKLAVATEDMPTYVGGQLIVGGQFDMVRSLSAFAELRVLGFFNQTPMIMGGEVALGLLYWP